MTKKLLVFSVVVLALLTSCKKSSDGTGSAGSDISESAQQIGDVMSSIDESSGSTSSSAGAFSIRPDNAYATEVKTLARILGENIATESESRSMQSRALCYGLLGSSFSSCSSNQRVRTFSDCTVGTATMTGTVILSYSQAACTMANTSDSVSRNPNFTVTGPRGGTLTVSKTGAIGQLITRTGANAMTFENDGIRRVIAKNSTTLYDFTTETTSALTITTTGGRSGRVITGGTLKVTNNLTSSSCSLSPANVTWDNTCNCPVSGSWTGTCTSASTSATLTITGCGTASYQLGSESETFSFDRCISL